jgi:hypothetical protein
MATAVIDRTGSDMEIKIGIRDTPRELVFESDATPEQVQHDVSAALASDGDVLKLADEKGRLFLVPVSALAYVEIGQPSAHRIGFGA